MKKSYFVAIICLIFATSLLFVGCRSDAGGGGGGGNRIATGTYVSFWSSSDRSIHASYQPMVLLLSNDNTLMLTFDGGSQRSGNWIRSDSGTDFCIVGYYEVISSEFSTIRMVFFYLTLLEGGNILWTTGAGAMPNQILLKKQ
jgi:hypothetical protein